MSITRAGRWVLCCRSSLPALARTSSAGDLSLRQSFAALAALAVNSDTIARTGDYDPEVELNEREAQFVERMGLLVEEDGWPRIAGRILGYLMVTPEECSLDDIASALGVSRASVSTDARRLAQAGMLERHGRPGDRRDYYRVAAESVRSSLRARIRRLRQYRELIDSAARDGLGGAGVRERLAGWSEAHGLVLSAIEGALAELDLRADGHSTAH